MIRVKGVLVKNKVLLLAIVAVLVLVLSVPAGAQGYTGWLYHPTSGNYVYCDYYNSQFWCYLPHEDIWSRATSAEMMQQVDGWQRV